MSAPPNKHMWNAWGVVNNNKASSVHPWESDPVVKLEQKYKRLTGNEAIIMWAFAHLLADILVGHKYPSYFGEVMRRIRKNI